MSVRRRKRCSKCGRRRSITKFSLCTKSKDGKQKHCIECNRNINKIYHSTHKHEPEYKAKREAVRLRRRHEAYCIIVEYLTTHACVDCGEDDPVVLEFDHENRSDKLADISAFASHGDVTKLKAELSKCVVRCANCHKRKTFKELGWPSRAMALKH